MCTAPSPAVSSRCCHSCHGAAILFATVPSASNTSLAPWPATSCSVASSSQQQFSHHGAPASNKPHPAEKSTSAWLAIWHIWAGFANSQLLPDAAPLYSIQGLQRSGNFSAQTSASLHPPASLRLRVLPFTRRWSSTVCKTSSAPQPATSLSPRRPGQQQTSSGGEKHSGLASNLAHLGRIC